MATRIGRRDLLQATVAGGILYGAAATGHAAPGNNPTFVRPAWRRSKVRVGRVYIAGTTHVWPTPDLDLDAEIRQYEKEFERLAPQLADIEFVGNRLITSDEQIDGLADDLKSTDGILVIHLGMGIRPILPKLLSLGRPTAFFAVPYSGHEWTSLGEIRQQEEGALLECLLTSDFDQLAVAVRPFRAIHHLRESRILNVTTSNRGNAYAETIRNVFGTETKFIDRQPVLDAYESISEADARAEADRWISQAEAVMEPSRDEIVRSCRLALAFEKLLEKEDATVMTVDCYGTMYQQLPAFPCIGFTRLNNMGLGGICESDMISAMTHLVFQGLVGRPGFISDPTMDVSKNAVILAHCLGTTKMDGPDGPAAPYRIRTIMERQQGAVPQVRMRIGQKVTQAMLVQPDQLLYFTGDIIETPDLPRGCRTKISVRVDGDAEKLWRNWTHGLHRVTCYGDITKDLERFCRYRKITMVNEAEQAPQV